MEMRHSNSHDLGALRLLLRFSIFSYLNVFGYFLPIKTSADGRVAVLIVLDRLKVIMVELHTNNDTFCFAETNDPYISACVQIAQRNLARILPTRGFHLRNEQSTSTVRTRLSEKATATRGRIIFTNTGINSLIHTIKTRNSALRKPEDLYSAFGIGPTNQGYLLIFFAGNNHIEELIPCGLWTSFVDFGGLSGLIVAPQP